jgi:hypothetical protein
MSTPGKPDPARGWQFVEKLLAEEEIARIEKMSPDEVEREMRAEGLDPSRVPSTEELVAGAEARAARNGRTRKAGAEPGAANVVPLPTRPKRSRRLIVLVAAALGALVLIMVMKRSEDNAATGQRGRERAENLRDIAMKECAEARWSSCKDWLDAARRLDSAGEAEPRVVEARRAIAQAPRADAGTR